MSRDDRRLPSISNQLPEHFQRHDLNSPPITPNDQPNPFDPSPKRRLSAQQYAPDPPYGHRAKRSNSAVFDPIAESRRPSDPYYPSETPFRQSQGSFIDYSDRPQPSSRHPSFPSHERPSWTPQYGSDSRAYDPHARGDGSRPGQLPPLPTTSHGSGVRLPPLQASTSNEERYAHRPSLPSLSSSASSSYAGPSSARSADPHYGGEYPVRTPSQHLHPPYPSPGIGGYQGHERRPSLASSMSSPSADAYVTSPTAGDASSHYMWEVPGAGADSASRKRRGNLPKESTAILNDWFCRHSNYPYPKEEEKQQLQKETGLTMSQISNWFINARRRRTRPSVGMGPTGPSGPPGEERR